MTVEMTSVVPIAEMKGEDDEDAILLQAAFQEATSYVRQFRWCKHIRESYFGFGIGGVVAVFLFRIEPNGQADEWLWAVSGDLPPAYIVTDKAQTPVAALEMYCGLMEDWVQAVRNGQSLTDVFPVKAPATAESASMLSTRINLLRDEVLPARR
jgi:hypothetical protein